MEKDMLNLLNVVQALNKTCMALYHDEKNSESDYAKALIKESMVYDTIENLILKPNYMQKIANIFKVELK